MRAGIEKRLAKLEQSTQQEQQRITYIELVCATTGKVGAIIPVGGGHREQQSAVMDALKYKHETDPPRKLVSQIADRP